MPGPVRGQTEAFQQMEAIMLRQLLQSSGAFRATDTPGSQMSTDLFVETLANAVAKAGGLGVAKMLEKQLGGGAASEPIVPSTPMSYGAAASSRGSITAPSGTGAVDDLDDPNSTAPLPEDPAAPSIDDFQAGAGGAKTAPRVALSEAAGEVTDQITSGFGNRVHPISGDVRFHTGVDLRAPEGAPIRAAGDGIVREAGRRGGYGNVVEIDHGNGTSTLYAHASSLLVKPGQHVERGEAVALVGQTGQATGPHLHFELRKNDHPVNPLPALGLHPTGRALNVYRKRVEDTGAGTPSSVGGEKPE
jgi:murein DD-endopeptidase MepM/ murein hydrolase activator NlpD